MYIFILLIQNLNNFCQKKLEWVYDQKLAKIIKDLKEVFKRIKLNVKGYTDILNNLDKPIN